MHVQQRVVGATSRKYQGSCDFFLYIGDTAREDEEGGRGWGEVLRQGGVPTPVCWGAVWAAARDADADYMTNVSC